MAIGAWARSEAEVPYPFRYPDFPTSWRALRSAGPMQGAIQTTSEKAVRRAVREATAPFENENGIVLENQFKYTVAEAA